MAWLDLFCSSLIHLLGAGRSWLARQCHQHYHLFIWQMKSRVKTAENITVPIQILSGVKPGYSLSSDALNLTLEMLLRNIAKNDAGYTNKGQRVS